MDTTKVNNLNEIDIYKEYPGGNKIIHLIVIQKNTKLLEQYLNKKYDLNITDSNNNTPYHLLLTSAYDLNFLKKIINSKVCWNNQNNNSTSILDLILSNNDIFNKLFSHHKFFMRKDILFGNYNNFNNICKFLSPENIIKFTDIIYFNANTETDNPSFFEILHNKHIKNISSFIKKIPNYKRLISIKDDMGDNLLGKFILIHKYDINKNNRLLEINQLVDLGFKPNYQNPITGSQPFKLLLLYVSDKDYLINYYKNNNINPNIIDNYGNNLALFTLFLYKKKQYKPDQLFSLILKNTNHSHKNLAGQSINGIFKNKFTAKNDETINNINLINIQLANTTEFRSRFDDILLYFIILDNKYKNLHIPKFNKNISSKNLDFNFNFLSLPTDLPLNLDMLPFFISFINQDNYYVHPYLNLIINNLSDTNPTDYSIIFLSVQDIKNNLHANILFYDFNNKTITRFEPYGNTSVLDNNLDEILEEELTWNTQFTYIKPSDYINGSGLQSLSDENNSVNQKPGDFGGFCLAWCLWFIEMKLTNSDISNHDLILKSLRKIIKKHSLVEYIRSYGNKITKEKYTIYKQINLPKNIWSNIVFDDNDNHIILQKIIKYLNL